MSVTREQELGIKQDQLEAQLRLIESRLEREDDQGWRSSVLPVISSLSRRFSGFGS